MSTRFQITEEMREGVLVFTVGGPLDAASALDLKEAILRRAEEGILQIVVIFQEGTYVNSTTVGILLSSLRHLRMNNGDLRLAQLGETNEKVFEIMGADRLMDVFETLEEALNSFKARDGKGEKVGS